MRKLSYKLIRSNRKTICLTVQNGEIIVKAPMYCPSAEIEQFLQEKSKWIANKQQKYFTDNQAISSIMPNQVLYYGDIIEIPDRYNTMSNSQKAFYEDKSLEILEYARQLQTVYELSAKAFFLTNAKKMWGVCTGENNIRLNSRLVMLPKELINYVILHELVHTVHHNHSNKFWELMKQKMPNCQILRKKLKNYGWVLRLNR